MSARTIWRGFWWSLSRSPSPLAALRGFSDNTRVLLERGDQASARENLEAIAALTERMGKITNQLKLFVGRARPRSARAPIVRALRNVVALLQKRLQGVEVEFTLLDAASGTRTPLSLADDHPELIANCDDLRLEQVLINLLGNALDATAGMSAPRIVVEIEVAEANLSFAVSDNGPGMAADQLNHIFERFTRGDAGLTQHVGGTGLGLAISKSLVELHGGTIAAESVEGQGSTWPWPWGRRGWK